MENENKNVVLEVKDLHVSFDTYAGEVKAVRGVTFNLHQGEVLAIVGESGCGKSVTAQTVMKLNPTKPVGKQIVEAIKHHRKLSGKDAKAEAIKYLKMVNIPNPEERAKQYPHEFSGGMRQRAMIAMALSCSPKVLIADEPTTALDVTIQAQIMDLLAEIKEETDTAIILITHDLGVVAGMADRVAVMYAGKIVETGTVQDVFYRNAHPYTQALLKSLPTIDSDKKDRLVSIAGTPPDLLNPPKGCGFAARCKHCMHICKEEQPPEFTVGENHTASCWLLHPDCPSAEERGEKDVD